MKKTWSILCAAAMTAALLPCTASADFSSVYNNPSSAVGRVQAETDGAVLESRGSLSKADYTVGEGTETYLVLSGEYNDADKPYVKYRVYADKAGTYAMYIDSSSIPEGPGGNSFSPYTIKINDNEPIQIAGIPMYQLSGSQAVTGMASYIARNSKTDAAQYTVFVALEAGANDITFTVNGATAADASKYRFELNWFSFKFQRDNTDGDAAAANYVYAGNSYVIANDGGSGIYAFYNNNADDKAYVDYTVCAPCDGAYELSFVTNKGVTWLSDIDLTINNSKTLHINSSSNDVESKVVDATNALYTNTATVSLRQGMNKLEFRAVSARGTNGSNYYMRIGAINVTPAKTAVEAESITFPARVYTAATTTDDKYAAIVLPVKTSTNTNTIQTGYKVVLSYNVDVTKDGAYDMLIDMSGYVEPTELHSYRAPIKMKVDDGAEIRLNTSGNYYISSTDTSHELTGTVTKIADLSYDNDTYKDQFKGFYGRYMLTEPITLTEGKHTITFIVDSVARNTGNALAALGRFDLVYTGDVKAAIGSRDGLMAIGETNTVKPIFMDGSGKRLSDYNVTYYFANQLSECAPVTSPGGVVTASSVGTTRIYLGGRAINGTGTAHKNLKNSTYDVQVYDPAKPFLTDSKSISGNTVTLGIVSDGAKDAELIVGRYKSDERFVDHGKASLGLTAAPCAVIKKVFDSEAAADKVSAFIWNSLDGCIPYSDIIKVK